MTPRDLVGNGKVGEVYDIETDTNNYAYLVGNSGVARLDGVRFTSMPNSDGIHLWLYKDPRGTI